MKEIKTKFNQQLKNAIAGKERVIEEWSKKQVDPKGTPVNIDEIKKILKEVVPMKSVILCTWAEKDVSTQWIGVCREPVAQSEYSEYEISPTTGVEFYWVEWHGTRAPDEMYVFPEFSGEVKYMVILVLNPASLPSTNDAPFLSPARGKGKKIVSAEEDPGKVLFPGGDTSGKTAAEDMKLWMDMLMPKQDSNTSSMEEILQAFGSGDQIAAQLVSARTQSIPGIKIVKDPSRPWNALYPTIWLERIWANKSAMESILQDWEATLDYFFKGIFLRGPTENLLKTQKQMLRNAILSSVTQFSSLNSLSVEWVRSLHQMAENLARTFVLVKFGGNVASAFSTECDLAWEVGRLSYMLIVYKVTRPQYACKDVLNSPPQQRRFGGKRGPSRGNWNQHHSNLICWNCGTPGHTRKNCQRPMQSQMSGSMQQQVAHPMQHQFIPQGSQGPHR